KIAEAISIIEREDSLQHIARMQPSEREDQVRKMVRKLRKEKGYKDDGGSGGSILSPFNTNSNTPVDIFASNKGEWYFNNNSRKSKGFNEFKAKWGDRANVDNWRRKSGMATTITNTNNPGNKGTNTNPNNSGANTQPQEISYEGLMKDIPLTEEKLAASNELIAASMIDLAKAYQNDLEEYQLAIDTYEEYLNRFPARLLDGEVYLGLYYCYTKLGNTAMAAKYKDLVNSKFASTKSGQMLNNPASLNPKTKDAEATKLYEDIYNLFIEGDFTKAVAEKKRADSLYGVNYWTPQLLYIEALNHVKNRNDSAAIKGLQMIIANDPNSPLKSKAETMISVLRRRAEIEKYLTELEVTRAEENQVKAPDAPKPVTPKPVTPGSPVIKDTVAKAPAPLSSGPFVMAVNAPHHVLMVLDKVDGVYVNEAKNAFTRYNRENYYSQPLTINKDAIDAEHNLLVISSFPDAASALLYYDKIKRSAASEVSWLPANKYSFLIITEENLQLLKTNKNLTGYKALLNTQFPNRF
ncbi:MAG TPA: hypothetical protein VHL77_10235, partial [Ferruginibacter sp.]|nr:hypothetical protein [Ferruginibacter sp.]